MDTTTWIILVVAALLVGAAVAWMIAHRRRSRHLRARFGPEYDHAVQHNGSRGRAEKDLEAREARVRDLDIRPLTAADRERYAHRWQEVQARFVEDPLIAVAEADRLVDEVMRERGYPVGNFEQRAADISVDHPKVVEHYRAARAIAHRARQGKTTTEELRQAMVHYRVLFEDLLIEPHAGDGVGTPQANPSTPVRL